MQSPTTADYQAWLPKVCEIAKLAGNKIVEIYQQTQAKDALNIEKKTDGTPVTIADKAADQIIQQQLAKLTPNIPIISEESVDALSFASYQNWQVFWLVDPLDGTKEFIERTGEFCVNIALVVAGKPTLGVVYGPIEQVSYAAYQGSKAFKFSTTRPGYAEIQQQIQVKSQLSNPVRVAVSRRHGKRVKHFFNQLEQQIGAVTEIHLGSALKSCLVAEGKADVYPRFGPTSLWDTAACQVIVEAAGGRIVDANLQDLSYQLTEDLLNPVFMVIGDQDFAWPLVDKTDYL